MPWESFKPRRVHIGDNFSVHRGNIVIYYREIFPKKVYSLSRFELHDGEKFAFLAVEKVSTDLPESREEILSDDTSVLTGLPVEVSDHWADWLGSIRLENLKRANLILARKLSSMNPGVLDHENQELAQYLTQVFYMLQLSGPVEYDGAHLLEGSVIFGETQLRQVSKLPDFIQTKGYVSASASVDLPRLHKAVESRSILPEIFSDSGDFKRVGRGLNVLLDGLRQKNAEERLHQFVRSLEALILPKIGNTKSQFVHRCQTFARPSRKAAKILREVIELRSNAEHLNDWELPLSSYPKKEREYIAFQRTWQVEKLARHAYSRIFDDAGIRSHFRTESMIRKFWTTSEKTRSKIWGEQLELTF